MRIQFISIFIDMIYILIHKKNYAYKKVKMTNNLEQKEYMVYISNVELGSTIIDNKRKMHEDH